MVILKNGICGGYCKYIYIFIFIYLYIVNTFSKTEGG